MNGILSLNSCETHWCNQIDHDNKTQQYKKIKFTETITKCIITWVQVLKT